MTSALFDLSGKVALVTGATQGLGHSMARGLAGAGATGVVTGRTQATRDGAAAALAAETGPRVVGRACPMGDWGEIEALVDPAYSDLDCDEVIGTAIYLAGDASSLAANIDLKIAGGMR